ncbi:MAG TPA: hypothetical protein VLS89_13465, partial [Candidatus Nanopelagicales bacterium]|nr:hypothetical protein [Candidatus Nanopelagicales bacterium]
QERFDFHASLAEGLGFRTSEDRFALDAGVLAQVRGDATLNGGELMSDGFTVLTARPYLRARAYHEQVRFFVQPELGTATPKLLDLEITWQPIPEIGLKVGQFLTPFSRAYFTPLPLLQFQDFSRVNERFRAGRDTGAMLLGSAGKGRLEYYAGAFNGNGIDRGGNDDTSLMGIARIAVNPVRQMPYDETPSLRGPVPFGIELGVNGIADRAHPTREEPDPTTGEPVTVELPAETRLTVGADIAVAWGGFTFLTEGYTRLIRPEEGDQKRGFGAYAQAGYFVIPQRLELAARAGWMNPVTSKPDDEERSVEAQVNGYVVGNHLKMGARYQLLHLDAPSADGFQAGNNHRLLFHVQFWI